MSDASARFERLFEDCYPAVLRYAARRVPAEAAQDIVSETFLVAWRRGEEIDGDPLPWLLGVARRVIANHVRGSARRAALRLRISQEYPVQVIEEPGGGDVELARALASLSARDREALMLVAWDGLGHADAARVMGCSTGAFTVRLHRARHRLARSLHEEEPALQRMVIAEQLRPSR